MTGGKFTVEFTAAVKVTACLPFLELFDVLFNSSEEQTQKKSHKHSGM